MKFSQLDNSGHPYTDWRVRSKAPCASFPLSETVQTIHERFEKQVLRSPSQISIKNKDNEITYAALNKMSNRIARTIIHEDSDAMGQVALLLGLNPAAISAIIGVLKSGKVYIPIDPSWPRDWISFILDNSEAKIIIANHRTVMLAKEFAHSACRIINVDEIDSGVSDENLNLPGSPDSPAYILYTSGSTGRPKGVVHTHRNLLQQIRNYTNNVGITPSDRLLLLHSLSFGASPMNLYGSLLNGAAVYPFSVKEEGVQRLADWLMNERITVCHFGPTLFRHFVGALAKDRQFPALRLINLGGEPLFAPDVHLFKSHFLKGCILVNSLACTEVGTFAQYFIDHDSEVPEKCIPAGHPFGDIEISLVDDNGNKVDPGHVGEIVLQSKYLSPGYWRNLELTQRVYFMSPDQPGKRIFFTGDIGRMHPDGLLEHMGRKDFQVKIRGHRIEIGDIEAIMRGISDIREAVVVGVDDQLGDKHLVAYVVAQRKEKPSVSALRAHISNTLPEYMIPSQFIFIDTLPTTEGGKVDRNALRVLRTIDRPSVQETFVEPRTNIENKLAEIWARLLNVRRVGIDDNFFELGGDSLSAIELSCWIEQEFGTRVLPYELLQSPTIRQIASSLFDRKASNATSCLVTIKSGGSRPPLFLLPGVTNSCLTYRELIKHLDPTQPVYGIEGSHEVLQRPIEKTASHYVSEICRVVPSGPFLLLGFSSGGVMALEMAQQLLSIDREVAFLGMLDTFFPRALHGELPGWKMIFSAHFIRNLPFWLYYFLPLWIRHYCGMAKGWRQSRNQGNSNYGMREIIQWIRNYLPKKYPGRIILYQARAQGLFEVEQKKQWGKVCDSLRICIVPGNHLSILQKPNARFLAEKINLELDRVFTEGIPRRLPKT